MKKRISLLGAYCIMCVLGVCLICLLTCSCTSSKLRALTGSKQEFDSILVEQYIDRTANPEFVSTKEVIKYQSECNDLKYIDSVFTSLPREVLNNVASVCIKRDGSTNKRCIVDEYLNNIPIYNNLPKNDTTSQVNNTIDTDKALEAPPTRVESPTESLITYNYKDTVMNGKKVRVETKTITYE